MDRLHVAIVHNSRIPARTYGGTERLLWWLAQALTGLGHRVTFVVPDGSACAFASVVTFTRWQQVASLVPRDADIVHATDGFNERIPLPFIITHNGNAAPGQKFHPNTVFVSRDHARRHKSDVFVYNGLNLAEYPMVQPEEKEPYCFFLAKARWGVKNVRGAIQVAKKAGVPIRVIGGWRPSLSSRVKWCGMLGGDRKLEILSKGSALLFPVRWHEPFGIAIIEAMATGSPVFGTPYGSLPELVTPETGYLSVRSDELADALKTAHTYSPKELRRYVMNNFSHTRMAEKYLELYHHVLQGRKLNPHEPETLSTVSPLKLLEWN